MTVFLPFGILHKNKSLLRPDIAHPQPQDLAYAQSRTVNCVEDGLVLYVLWLIDDREHFLLAQHVGQIPTLLGPGNVIVLAGLPKSMLIIALNGIYHHVLFLIAYFELGDQLKHISFYLLFGERSQFRSFKITEKLH